MGWTHASGLQALNDRLTSHHTETTLKLIDLAARFPANRDRGFLALGQPRSFARKKLFLDRSQICLPSLVH